MIIQRRRDELLFIRQPDHAALAAEMMAHWQDLADHPRRDAILAATRDHDDGWREEDEELHVSGGEPLDFVAVPPEIKHRVWPRAAERLARTSPYVAALVAEHALTIHAALKQDPVWRSFFARMTRTRDDLLSRVDGASPETLTRDYKFVRTGDQLSLIFCNAWTTPMAGLGYKAILTGTALEIAPDPFGGRRIPLRVEARPVAARRFDSAADLRQALAAAPVVVLEGYAAGSSPS